MFLVDDILLSPGRGLMFVLRELHAAVEQELESEGDTIREQLSELYMMLETERISEAEFDRREAELLDRLDEFEARAPGGGGASL